MTAHGRAAILLTVLCFVVYGNVLAGEFVWDDHLQVVRNLNIRSLANLPRAFTTSLWSFAYSTEADTHDRNFDRYYRPLQTVFYIIGYRIGGLSPVAYHAINVVLHSAASLLIYFLCIQLGLSAPVGVISAALFAVHPVHTEAVSWIAGVGDVSAAVFYFGGLFTFLRYLKDRRMSWLWASAACLFAALLSKEMAATLPLVALLLLFRVPKKRRPAIQDAAFMILPFVAAVAVYAVLRIRAVGSGIPSVERGAASLFDWVTLGVWAAGNYLRYVVIPFPLYVYHLVPLQLADRILSTSVAAAVVLTSIVIAWRLRNRLPQVWLWLAVFGTTLLPVLYFRGISGGFLFAERYMYIPSMAAVILAGFLLARLSPQRAIAIGSVIVLVFAVMTLQRNRDWRTEERLFQSALRQQPEAVTIWANLGEVHLRHQDRARAQDAFTNALEHMDDRRFFRASDDVYRTYLGLGTIAFQEMKPMEAVDYLQMALEINPQGHEAYTQLGGVLINFGANYRDAAGFLEKAVKLSAVNEVARYYLGVALFNLGRPDDAIQYFREALQLNPELEAAKQYLDLALKSKGAR